MADSYELVKREIKKKSISNEELHDLKDEFRDDIESTRLMACIESIGSLIEVLECRDTINKDKTDALEKMAEMLGDTDINKKLTNDRSVSEQNNFVNQYALERKRDEIEDQMRIEEQRKIYQSNEFTCEVAPEPTARMPRINSNPVNSASYSGRNRTTIHKLIATEIGRKWRDFGRGLEIREGEMDELDMTYGKDFKTKIIKMIELFEEPGRVDPRKHIMIICQSLEESKRNDLSKKVQEILTR